MNKGNTVQVRLKGAVSWTPCLVDLASSNQRSFALSADEGLATPAGFALNKYTGRMQVLLLRDEEGYHDIFGTIWEVKETWR